MNGWLEWLGLVVGMVVGGIGLLVLVINPLLSLLLAGAVGLVYWIAAGPRPATRIRQEPPRRP